MGKCLVLFVEGDTEVEFYKRLIKSFTILRTIASNFQRFVRL